MIDEEKQAVERLNRVINEEVEKRARRWMEIAKGADWVLTFEIMAEEHSMMKKALQLISENIGPATSEVAICTISIARDVLYEIKRDRTPTKKDAAPEKTGEP